MIKPVMLYMGTMTDAIVSGDLNAMKKVAAEAEAHLASHGDVATALTQLKIEIAKLEAKKA